MIPRLPYFPGCAARLRRSFDDARDASFQNIRNKDFLSYLGFAASLIFAIGINVFSRSIGNFENAGYHEPDGKPEGHSARLRTIFRTCP